jgi:type I restriction enzyme S subunit
MIDGLKPYPAYKDSGVPWLGKVPGHWDVLRARYLFREVDLRTSTGAETHLSMSQRLGLVPSSEMLERKLVSESYVGGKRCEPDDLVLNRLKAHLGVFARASQAGVVSPDYTVFRRISASVSMRYFEPLLKSPACRGEFRTRAKGLVEGFWRLAATDFRDAEIKEGKQSEFLVQGFFPWHLVRRIGVHGPAVQQRVLQALTGASHRQVKVFREWYF